MLSGRSGVVLSISLQKFLPAVLHAMLSDIFPSHLTECCAVGQSMQVGEGADAS